ncbi:MAG: phosphoribosylanthranilate isomerase [bacterium]
MVKIKICGITNEKDALWAVNLGADYIGFNFYKDSPRKISPKLAGQIIGRLPPFTQPVGLFVNAEMKAIKRIAEKCRLNLVQLHGEETPEYCRELQTQSARLKIIKAFRMRGKENLGDIERYNVDYYLLDSYVPGIEGGTGEIFNWDLAVEAKQFNKPVFLAGGLTPDNVVQAIEKVNPYGVDVASGVERTPRRKDYDLMREFINRIRTKRL